MTDDTTDSILLIGASRGLGLALAKEWLDRGAHVVATVRGADPTPLDDVKARFGDRLEIERLDITDTGGVTALHDRLAGREFTLLFVNAGTANGPDDTVATVTDDDFVRLMVTNALSPMRVVERFDDLVAADGTIAIMSSGQGSIANNERGGFEVYRASKSALNQLMRSYAARHADDRRTLLLAAPGWVRGTGVGGPDGALTIEESIPRLVDTLEDQRGHGGLQYLDYLGRTIPW